MQRVTKPERQYADLLREAGFKATYGRVELLRALHRANKPLRVEAITKAVKGKLDLVNTYRALDALCAAGLVRRVDLGHAHTHYVFAGDSQHQHIFVCTSCGVPKTR
jgi:Fur family transcriptional regulator, ferric uptake regulator